MKDELVGKLMTEFATLTHIDTKTYSYLKAKSTKRCPIKRKLKFEDYKHLEATQLQNKLTRKKYT